MLIIINVIAINYSKEGIPIDQLDSFEIQALKASIAVAIQRLLTNISLVKQKGTNFRDGNQLIEKYNNQLDRLKEIDFKKPLSDIPTETLSYIHEHIHHVQLSCVFLKELITHISNERNI